MAVRPPGEPQRGGQASLIIRNSAFLAAARGIQILFFYLITVVVTRYLSVGDYGEYAFIVALVGAVMSLTDFGAQQVLIREIARDRANAGVYVGTALVLRGALSAVAIAGLLVAVPFLGVSAVGKAAVPIAIVAELFLAFTLLARSVFQAYEQMVYEPLLALFGSLALAGGIAAVIFLDLGFLWLFAAAAAANALQLGVSAWLVQRRMVRPSFSLRVPLLRSFLKHIAVIALGVFLFMNLIRVNVFMLKWLCTIEEVAFFQLPHNLIFQIQVLPYALVTAIFPVFSRLVHEAPERMAGMYEKVFKYLFIASLFAALCLSLFSREIIEVVFGAKYAPSVPVLAVVAWGIVPLAMDMLLFSILVAMKKQKYSIYYSAFAIALSVLGGLFLLPRYGALGAAALSLLAYGILFACSFTLVSRYTVAIRLPALLGELAPAVALTVGLALALKPLSAAAALLAVTAAYFGVLWARGVVTPAEVQTMRNAGKGLLGRGPRP